MLCYNHPVPNSLNLERKHPKSKPTEPMEPTEQSNTKKQKKKQNNVLEESRKAKMLRGPNHYNLLHL